jgi:hypothetical protein
LITFGSERRLKLEIEALERLVEREAGHGGLHRGEAIVFGGELPRDELLEEVRVRLLVFARLLQQKRQLLGCTHQLEPAHLLLDPLDLDAGAHRPTSSISVA